jgi:hypothetical protein
MSLKKQAEKAVKSEATVPFTKRFKKKSSLVWQHFQQSETLLDTAECNLCRTQIVCKNGNTTGMWLHMKRIHQQINLKNIKTEDLSAAAELAFNDDESCHDGLDYNNDLYDPSNLLDVKHEIFGNDRGSEDPQGTVLSSPTKTRSLVWNYFKKSIPAMAVCDLCGKDICTVGNNTSGMINRQNITQYVIPIYIDKIISTACIQRLDSRTCCCKKKNVILLYIRVSVVLIYSLSRKEREKLDITLDSMVLCLPELRKYSKIIVF